MRKGQQQRKILRQSIIKRLRRKRDGEKKGENMEKRERKRE